MGKFPGTFPGKPQCACLAERLFRIGEATGFDIRSYQGQPDCAEIWRFNHCIFPERNRFCPEIDPVCGRDGEQCDDDGGNESGSFFTIVMDECPGA